MSQANASLVAAAGSDPDGGASGRDGAPAASAASRQSAEEARAREQSAATPVAVAVATAVAQHTRVTGRGKRRQRRIEDSARRRADREAAAAAAAAGGPPSPAEAWDAFYAVKPTFFKDRHLLRAALPELMPPAVRENPRAHIPRLEHAQQQPCVPNSAVARTGRVTDDVIGSGQDKPLVFVEAGCGVGNALFPVLRANPAAFAYAFDFSATAIDILRASPEYHPSRTRAFVADLAQPETYLSEISQPVDFVLAVWALSALRPGVMLEAAASGLARLLRPGGMVMLRDYADGDMRMHMFRERRQQGDQSKNRVAGVGAGADSEKNSDSDNEENNQASTFPDVSPSMVGNGENETNGNETKCTDDPNREERLFTRGDRTWAYFFRVDEMSALMSRAGLEPVECRVEERIVENRKNGAVMRRRWLVGRFRKPVDDAESFDS